MYDLVPHTKPILVTGTATGEQTLQEVRGLNVQASSYEGPTSIASVISQEAASRGIETMGLIAHLPQYAQLEADHAGRLCILDLLSKLYNFTMDLDRVRERARQQYDEVTAAMNRSPEVKGPGAAAGEPVRGPAEEVPGRLRPAGRKRSALCRRRWRTSSTRWATSSARTDPPWAAPRLL